ncbi:MAG: iron-containing alcohol dehydrogenase [Caldilinea sp.]|nr:iron-containing alcohol dehydrogenase [Caldilinea sp.]MDW8441053.1 iron-containing alcohol dehydrogenase [Caldilineaceae bacterium]
MNSNYTIDPFPLLIVGPGALDALPDALRTFDVRRILLVSDQGMAAAGWVQRVYGLLSSHWVVEIFLAPPGEPRTTTIDEGAAMARALGENVAVVGLGGGTALDIAKLIAAVAVGKRPVRDYLLSAHPYDGKLPGVMIPATSGTGAEVTRTCVLTDEQGHKSWAWGDELRPNVALLDPQVTTTLPKPLTVATGLDALVHAIEAATAQRANAIAQSFALQAIRLIVSALPVAATEPQHLSARQQMQEAACLAGMAIDLCGTGVAHAIGHALGTVAHLPHAVAVAIAMQSTLAWSVEPNEARYQAVAHAMQLGLSAPELSEAFTALLQRLDFDEVIRPLCERTIDLDALLASMRSPENQPMRANNARVADDAELAELAQRTLHTWNAWRRKACIG